MSDLGRHRRVYSLDWLQAPFQSLDDGERVLCLYLRTGPQSTSVGCYRLSAAVACEELANITIEQFEERLTKVCAVFNWPYDNTTRVLWIPEHLQQNPPQSPNVVTSWRKLLGNVPDCLVKAQAVEAIHQQLKELPEAFRKAFGSYRVSLPEAHENSQAKPKAKPSSHQGSGIRGSGKQGSEIRGAGLRAVENGDEQQRCLRIAREVVRSTASQNLEELIVFFKSFYLSSYREDYQHGIAVEAINVALSERRAAS